MKYERNREHFAISAGDSHVCFFRLQCVVTAHHRQGLSWYALLLLLLILEVLIVCAGSAFLRFARVPRLAAFQLLKEINILRRILLLRLLTII